jgi:hypothetical protein
MVKNGNSYSLIRILKSLFNSIICSGFIPTDFNRVIVNLIIKDNKKKAFEINNYGPVSISNYFSQIFERIILKLSPNLQKSDENQFGFKMGLSTYQPLFLVKETISKYKISKTPCYVVSLDAEKACDSLWRNGLFFKLIDKIDSIFWFLLFDYYSQSDGLIFLSESQKSDIFKINRGVKQGGILSQFLFNIHIDDLFGEINQSDYGFYLNQFKTTNLGYFGDLILKASSKSHMQILLDKCQNYSEKWNIKFNASKSISINAGLKIYDDLDIHIFINHLKLNVFEERKY